ncbi:MAG: DUF882 domain-containing protein [Alphaproteobacteria bacterium]|nr:DUF882 domain-containing protein [Alphaproteobacteria bacterium]
MHDKRLAAALLASAMALSGCVPMALFASGGGKDYAGYKSSWGTYVASSTVNTICMTPTLRLALLDFEGRFGKKVVLNSGYRSPNHNDVVGGADDSYHVKCMAADFFIPGVPKSELIAHARRSSLVGGLGCYPDRNFIHIDVRSRPAGARGPVTFSGC